MTSPRKSRCLTAVIVALICSAAWAAEPNEPAIHLEFEISRTPLAPYSSTRRPYGSPTDWSAFANLKPAYAVDIVIVGPTYFLPFPNRATWSRFLGHYAMLYAGLSEGQKALLVIVEGLLSKGYPRPPRSHIDPNHPEHLLLYATTLEDARKMAVAYYQYATREFQERYAKAENWVRTCAEDAEKAQKRIAELEKRSETAQKEFLGFQKTVHYRTETEAQEAVSELDRMLNNAQIEVAGITAKIEAIQSYRQSRVVVQDAQGRAVPATQPVTPPETTAKLNAMFIEESIALRAAQAREQMATRLREQANRFIDLKSTLANAPGEKKALTETLETAQRSLSSWQDNLANTKQQQPKIPAKVVIYPVLWADEPAQN